MQKNLQLDLFRDEQAAKESKDPTLIKTIHTDLGPFGNRTDVLIVEKDTVRGTSLLECDNPDATYHF